MSHWFYVRIAILFSAVVLMTGGCATHSRAVPDQFSEKRNEIGVVQEELSVAIGNLDHLQRELAIRGGYPTAAQARDLDYFLSVMREARDKITAEDRRIHQEYRVSYGPY